MAKKQEAKYGWLRPDFVYTPSDRTDVMARFKQLGWTPPTEYRTDYIFNKGVKGDD